jgi:hypothetical protein
MHEQRNVQVADDLKGNRPLQPVAEMKIRQQILFGEFKQAAVERSRFAAPPTARQLEQVIAVQDVAVGGVQFVDRDVTAVDQRESLRREQPTHVPGALRHAHAGAHHERGCAVALLRVLQLGIQARQRTEMTREARS